MHSVPSAQDPGALFAFENRVDIDVLSRSAIDSGTVLNARGRAKSAFGLLMEVQSRPSGSLRLKELGEYVCFGQC